MTEPEDSPEQEVPAVEVERLIEAGARLVDVRADYEFDAAHLVGAERIGLETLAGRRNEIDPADPVVFYCRTGDRSLMAAQAFAEAGYEAVSLAGGITAWLGEGREIEPADGYISEPGQAASILEAKARAIRN